MEPLKTIATDIKHSVFDNESEAIMYITKDIYSDGFIVSIPVITFSCDIATEHDYKWLLRFNLFGDLEKNKRLVNVIKEEIAKFEL
ncbi:hypothetical protein [Halobacillus ihumii]|uniref:hypothetical protein n=1 Tax=Halobacillus ihumii TaxID=2686092 RepID=UPI0013D657A4|nr:hypothetical protein [Halobacillus ihumii]